MVDGLGKYDNKTLVKERAFKTYSQFLSILFINYLYE